MSALLIRRVLGVALVAGLATTCGGALMAPGASAAAARTARPAPAILTPRASSLVAGKTVRVRVVAGRNFQAIVGLRDVTARFGRARRGVRSALLQRGRDFTVGSNRLVVRSGRGLKRRYVAATFIAGRLKRGALHVRARRERDRALRCGSGGRSRSRSPPLWPC